MERAVKGTLGGNIMIAFAIGSGRPVERTRSGVQELVSSVNSAPPPPQRGLPCKHCHETFANEQGRGIHTRTLHPAANMRQGVRLPRMLGKEGAGRGALSWDRAGPGRCGHVEFDHTTGASSFTLQRKRFRNVDWESDAGFTTDSPKAARSALKRTRYDHRTKAHAVNQLRILQESEIELWDAEYLTPLQYLETFLKIHQSLISKWAKEEDKLVKLVASEVTKTLLATQQPKRWFPEAKSKLYELFLARRKKKLKVSTLWLAVTYRKLLQEMYPTDNRAAVFRPSFRWMQKWAKAHLLSKRRRNSKNKSVEEHLPAIQRFHRKFRKLLKQPVRRRGAVFPEDSPLEVAAARPAGETRLEKYGQFQPSERFNIDQVPLPFVNGQADTWKKTGEKRVAIAQPFAGLEERQCTMQVIFGPGSRPLRISVIFRGTGKRISPVERAA